MTAISDLLSARDRERLLERLAEFEATDRLMRQPGAVRPPEPPPTLAHMTAERTTAATATSPASATETVTRVTTSAHAGASYQQYPRSVSMPWRNCDQMGIIKESKASTAAQHASRAASEGRTVFLYRFNVPATSSGWSGPVSGAAEVIEAIERNGWQLGDFAYERAQSDNGAVLLLFRRAQQQPASAPKSGHQREAIPDRQIPAALEGYREPYERSVPQQPGHYAPAPGGDSWAQAPAYGQQEGRLLPNWPQEPPPGRRHGRHQDPRQQGY